MSTIPYLIRWIGCFIHFPYLIRWIGCFIHFTYLIRWIGLKPTKYRRVLIGTRHC
jgi:hypothetical protein